MSDGKDFFLLVADGLNFPEAAVLSSFRKNTIKLQAIFKELLIKELLIAVVVHLIGLCCLTNSIRHYASIEYGYFVVAIVQVRLQIQLFVVFV
ncbi:hypothetical protein V5J35_004679 [Endozoicomonas sp. NE40]|uniref:Uncharacterized protein n=1 Tax=Endozoicomonas lisbonensis TaxID=3120522 RepID=A0ABV2SNZ1_9GAMM